MTIEEAVSYVEERFPVPGYVDATRDVLTSIGAAVGRYLSQGDRVLDFGAGRCAKTAVVHLLGFPCSAYDDLGDVHLTNEMKADIVAFAADIGIDLRVGPYGGSLPYPESHFAMVMMHDVLEHLPESPRVLLTELLRLAEPRGYLFLTVPNAVNIRKRLAVLRGKTNYPPFEHFFWHPKPWRGHVREYTRDDLVLLCRYLGLDIVELRSHHHMIGKLQAWARPVYRAITATAPGLRDTWLLVARKPEDWKPDLTPPVTFDVNYGRIGFWD